MRKDSYKLEKVAVIYSEKCSVCGYLNYSSIATKLIKCAAECKSYSSDMLITWAGIQRLIDNPESGNYEFWFGFREMGVDCKSFIENRISSAAMYGVDENFYRKIYKVQVNITRDYMEMRLIEFKLV